MNQVDPTTGDWFFYVCAVGLALLAIQKAVTNRDVLYYFRIFYEFDLGKVEDEVKRIHLENFVLMYLNYLIALTISILMFFTVAFSAAGFGLDFFSFLKLLFGLLIFLISKHLVHQILLSLFTSPELTSLINKNFEISNSFISTFSLPVFLVAFYTMNKTLAVVWISLVLSAVLYLYNLAKLASFLKIRTGVSEFFILIYLCSVEILPVVWVTAWLSNKV